MHSSAIRFRRRFMLLPMLAVLLTTIGCEAPNPYLRGRAQDAMERRDYDRSDQLLTKAVDRHPGDWKATMLLGETKLKQGKPLEAQLLLEKAYTMRIDDSESARILNGLAEALYRQERYENLYSLLNQTTRERGDPEDYMRQAHYLARMGDPDGARVAFDKAARFAKPDDPRPYLAMADYYEQLGDRQATVTALRRAFYIRPNDPKLATRLRAYGIVPGPTAGLPPTAAEPTP